MAQDKAFQSFCKNIGIKIKAIRKAKGLTQEEAAEAFGFDFRLYQRLEQGSRSYDLYTLFRLAKAFKVEVKDLLK